MWTDNDATAHLDKIIELSDEIKAGELTILTGSNGSGKSLIRKVIANQIAEQLGTDPNKTVSSTSMQRRTESNPEFGALSSMMADLAWMPTSTSTWNLIKGVLNHGDRYVVIDEPEIGCSEEVQLAMIIKIMDFVNKLESEKKFKGMLIITHSRLIVDRLPSDKFINIDGMTKREWLERKLVVYPLEELENNSNKLHSAVQRRTNENKAAKKSKKK